MKRAITILFFLGVLCPNLPAQSTASFEGFNMEADTFLNGSDGTEAFMSGNAVFPVDYNFDFSSWTGWAISNQTDVTTPGFSNQYSAITGEGYLGSDKYAVAYVLGKNVIELKEEARGEIVNGFYVTNGTYPYLSMLDGDMFAKKFGGSTGDDPDFFKLTVKKYLNGELGQDSVDFYLADFRFEDNLLDYILDDWAYVDLVPLGAADSLVLTLSSSDVGAFGINTPTYFCVDNFITSDGTFTSTEEKLTEEQFKVYPNPAQDYLIINTENTGTGTIYLYNNLGALLRKQALLSDRSEFNIADLPQGSYLIRLESVAGTAVRRIIKQ
jgi:hypothetical protein